MIQILTLIFFFQTFQTTNHNQLDQPSTESTTDSTPTNLDLSEQENINADLKAAARDIKDDESLASLKTPQSDSNNSIEQDISSDTEKHNSSTVMDDTYNSQNNNSSGNLSNIESHASSLTSSNQNIPAKSKKQIKPKSLNSLFLKVQSIPSSTSHFTSQQKPQIRSENSCKIISFLI